MEEKYLSKYKGEQFDDAIGYMLSLTDSGILKVIPSTDAIKYDLNELVQVGIYVVQHFVNGYVIPSGEELTRPIRIQVLQAPNNFIEQKYSVLGTTVHRYYNTTTFEWSDWEVINDVVSVDSTETVRVSKPTLVLRHGTEEVNTVPDIPYNNV